MFIQILFGVWKSIKVNIYHLKNCINKLMENRISEIKAFGRYENENNNKFNFI